MLDVVSGPHPHPLGSALRAVPALRLAPASSLPSAPVLATAAIAALALVCVLALARASQRPEPLPLLAVFALPFRLPISAGGRTVNLLIPAVPGRRRRRVRLRPALAARAPDGRPGDSDRAPRQDVRGHGSAVLGGTPHGPASWRAPRFARLALAAHGRISTSWRLPSCMPYRPPTRPIAARRRRTSPSSTCPSALLFLLLRNVDWTRQLLLRCLGVAVGLAVAFAGVGFVEYYRKTLFLNPKVVAADQFDNYFRVNSLFFDPNIYGRFLMLVMIAVMTVVLWTRSRRDVWIGAGPARLADRRAHHKLSPVEHRGAAARTCNPRCLPLGRARDDLPLRRARGDRTGRDSRGAGEPSLRPEGVGWIGQQRDHRRAKLISGGLGLFADRPLEGFGSGSFETEYRRHQRTSSPERDVRLAHDPDHRGGGAGDPRPGRLRRACC